MSREINVANANLLMLADSILSADSLMTHDDLQAIETISREINVQEESVGRSLPCRIFRNQSTPPPPPPVLSEIPELINVLSLVRQELYSLRLDLYTYQNSPRNHLGKKKERKPRTFKNRCLHVHNGKDCACYVYHKSGHYCYSHYMMSIRHGSENTPIMT